MKKYRYLIFLIVVIIILAVIAILFIEKNGLIDFSGYSCTKDGANINCFGIDYNKTEYCYSAIQGFVVYKIGNEWFQNKICDCDGVIIYKNCPIGALCEGYEARCYGNIVGMNYVFRNDGKQFDTLEQYRQYCDSLTEQSKKKACLFQLNMTKE